MMNRLDRYVATQVLSAIFIVLIVVLGLDFLFAYVDESQDATDTYTTSIILQYLLLGVPGSFYEFLPLSSLVGCLIGLGMLAGNSELTVMRAAGISTVRIVFSVVKPALLLAFISMAVGEFVVPKTEQLAQSIKATAEGRGKALYSQYGVWHREADTFIHINAVIPGGKIEGVTQFEFDKEGVLLSSSFAKYGEFKNQQWQLFDISKTSFFTDHTQTSTQDKLDSSLQLTPELLSSLVVEPEDLALTRLWSFANYLLEQELQADSYFLAFWAKVFQPLNVIALVMIGILFIFGPLRSVTVGQRVIAGVLTGLTFKFTQDIFAQMSSVAGLSPIVAVLVPIVGCMLLGYILLLRSRV